jgi:hypothetical protein
MIARNLVYPLLAPVILVGGACHPSLPDHATTETVTPTAPPAPPQAHTLDEGAFSFLLGGKPAGEESFTVVATGDRRELRTKSTLRMGDQAMVTEASIHTDATYRALDGEATIVSGGATRKLTLRRDGDNLVLSSPGQPDTTNVGDLFVMNGVASHVGLVCSLAGDEEKTVSLFPRLEIKLAPIQSDKVDVDGRSVDLHLVSLAGAVGIDVYCDGTKPVLIDQQGTFIAVRDGYAGLLPLVARAPAKFPIPPELDEQPRSVTVAGAKLACSLLAPRHDNKKGKVRPLPAVFFLTGSSPEDRDEDTVGPGGVKVSIFRHLAVSLARAGVASLRCDDRGVGESTGTLAGGTLETFAADAVEMAKALRKEPGIDGARIGVIGHSEGGVVAPIAAVRAKLRSVILLAAPGRPLDQLILDQSAYLLRRSGMPEERLKQESERGRKLYQAIREGKPYPDDTRPEEKKTFDAILPWLTSFLRHDPVAAAAKLTVPVFIGQGGKDFQVTLTDAEALRGALAKNPAVTVLIYPELSHMFAPVAKGTLADYSDPNLQVDVAFIADVVAFARKSLGAP